MTQISTPRLIIRRFAMRDVNDYIAYQAQLKAQTFLPYEAMSREKAISYVMEQAALPDEARNCYHAFAVQHIADNKVIGDVGFWRPGVPEDVTDIGFQFHPGYHGQGYATEAARALIQYAFEKWNLRRITSSCDVRNTPSFRVMERLGMRREAHFVQSRNTAGVLHDEYAYAILRDEWLALDQG